ncbi:hypothetical protein [Corynebacterium sp. A21]|uniref:hypothetical protein n=1 Tax=Corynebacterium sp. A21 TaxID=3457318 RepID=UPI003FD29DBB
MFGKKKKAEAEKESPRHIAAEQTDLPLDDLMTRLVAQELPLLDSRDRVELYQALKDYEGPQITSQEELPARIREILDL